MYAIQQNVVRRDTHFLIQRVMYIHFYRLGLYLVIDNELVDALINEFGDEVAIIGLDAGDLQASRFQVSHGHFLVQHGYMQRHLDSKGESPSARYNCLLQFTTNTVHLVTHLWTVF